MQPRSFRSALLALGLLGLAVYGAQAQEFGSSSGASGGSNADAPGLTVFSPDAPRADRAWPWQGGYFILPFSLATPLTIMFLRRTTTVSAFRP